ncbi:NADPH-dependent FMN reductase [Streptomyces iconiensis]|uniref:NAD(P)H-dependent oxidoreductase n=1 Tax=Streptomyces iconiensis TaxID=1384038 RepID=A0ABT7A4Z5_9ACTN|nr:NAD(P)H-dependent oxidoreductase [Streptomyces iconiensis]MDJ1136429.1 NAD(P)H-dependent oxidoreductase [Streptomyces iconiensis]
MPDSSRLRVAVIVGSTRNDRFAPVPAHWIAEQARAHGDFEVDVIDLLEERLPVIFNGDDPEAPLPDEVKALAPRIEAADAFVVVTAVYNRGYPASLKNAVDWFYSEWNAKPVGFVSYGGVGGGLHAVEQLRLVFNELHAACIRDAVSFANYWEVFDDQGTPRESHAVDGYAKTLLDQLSWWGHALRDARTKRPYKV